MTVAVIVQARLGSTRLPAKVLLPLPTGRTAIEEVLHRCKFIPGVNDVICATPDSIENEILAPFIRKAGCAWISGPEHDVLARYVKAANATNADVIMRVTADCPLLDPDVCGMVLDLFHNYELSPFAFRDGDDEVDYCSNVLPRSFPQGLDCEVFARDSLDRAHEEATEAYDREHVTSYMQRSMTCRKANVTASNDLSHLRWTLDTLEDYVRIWNEFKHREKEAA